MGSCNHADLKCELNKYSPFPYIIPAATTYTFKLLVEDPKFIASDSNVLICSYDVADTLLYYSVSSYGAL